MRISRKNKKTWRLWVITHTIILVVSLFSSGVLSVAPDIDSASSNAAYATPHTIVLCANVSHINGDVLNITFHSNLSGIWDYFYLGTNNVTFANVTNGSYCIKATFMTAYNTTYYWNVTVDNGTETNYSTTYNLTTIPYPINITSNTIPQSYSWLVGIIIVFSSFGIIAFIKTKRNQND